MEVGRAESVGALWQILNLCWPICPPLPLSTCLLSYPYNFIRRSRSELVTTKIELKAIAPAAIMGLSWYSGPRKGTSTPAAMGMASTL